MIHAYSELYINTAQNILGHAIDYAIRTLDVDIKTFQDAFLVSPISKQFSKGNPKYVSGINGCELAEMVLDYANIAYFEHEHIMYLDKTNYYWLGWALAYYQWYTNLSFMEIINNISFEEILLMYPKYHEMDIMKFVSAINKRINNKNKETNLKIIRQTFNYSQTQLAIYSNVPIRQIQLFEQKQRDINKTSGITLYKLANALHCNIEDLLEKDLAS